jgi:hypothetical protein
MSSEIEAAGAVMTAGLVASAIEKHGSGSEAHGPCPNCGAEMQGAYCAMCGQPGHVHRSLGHLIEEIVHGVLHLDARAWRTLPRLVFRPGTLTRNYISGQRARFISPLALFLFTVFAMFFVFSLTGESNPESTPTVISSEDASVSAESDTDGVIDVQTFYDVLGEQARNGEIDINTGFKSLDKKLMKKLENPELAVYKIQNTAYKFSFLLVPISLTFMWLLFFWKRGVTLFDHAVVVLYSLSFMSLLFVLGALTAMWAGGLFGPVMWVISIAIPVHMYFHLKGAYSLGWFSALWRTFFLLVFCTLALSLFVLAIVVLGLAG